MSTMSDFINAGANNQAQVDANTKALSAISGRNIIINGHMSVAQRGTSFPAAVHDAYTIDRWRLMKNSTGVVTISRETDSPSPYKLNSLKVLVTTDDTMLAGEFLGICQFIEGHNIKNFFSKTFTLSFWVKSSKIGAYTVEFRNADVSAKYVAEYNINVANTWEKKTITITGGLPSFGNWDTTTGIGIRLAFFLASGPDSFTNELNVWKATSGSISSNQVNLFDTVNATFFLTAVQLELGEQASEFELTSIPDEISKCQRYYMDIYYYPISLTSNANFPTYTVELPVYMRVKPVVTITARDQAGSPASVDAAFNNNYYVRFVNVASSAGWQFNCNAEF